MLGFSGLVSRKIPFKQLQAENRPDVRSVELDAATISLLVSAGLTVVSALLGSRYLRAKALLKTVIEAAEDDEISEEEFQAIVKAAKGLKSED